MAEENKGDNGAGDQKTEAQIEQKGAEQKPEPKYTDAQLNDLIAKEASKREAKARTELMEKLGVKTPEELDALKKLREEKMTEGEKAAAAIKEKDDALAKSKEEADNARAEAEAMKRGVPVDKLARFVKMASTFDGDTMAEKIEAAIKEFPEFAAKAAAGGSVGKETGHETQSEEEKLLALARKQVGLSK